MNGEVCGNSGGDGARRQVGTAEVECQRVAVIMEDEVVLMIYPTFHVSANCMPRV